MRIRARFLVLLAAGLVPAALLAGQSALDPTAAAIVREGRERPRAMAHLDFLCNSIGPRLTGSDGYTEACRWALGLFEAWGLSGCRLEQWGEAPVLFNRGPWWGRMHWKEGAEERRQGLEFNTPAWSAGTRGVRRGRALMAPGDAQGFERVREACAGAWLVVPLAGGRGRSGFDLARAALEAGCLGLVGGRRGELLQTGAGPDGAYSRLAWERLPRLPRIALVEADHRRLTALLAAGTEVELEFLVENRFRPGPVALHNVIADLPGVERPDEFVLVGAHLDSWDGATGAIDNGCGVATTLEAARLLAAAGARPRRTIRFCLWGGEEQGLLGSRAYVRAHEAELGRISAVLIHDGGTNYLSGIAGTPAMRADLERAFAPVLGLDAAMPFQIVETQGLRGGGSDHAPFIAAGVPGFFWRQAGRAVYGQTWHTQHDHFQRAIPEYQEHSALVVALGAWGLANLDGLLAREGMRPAAPASRPARGRFGLRLDGLTVAEVTPGSRAAALGLRRGDELLAVDGRKIEDLGGLIRALAEAGPSIRLTVKRGGSEVELGTPAPRRL